MRKILDILRLYNLGNELTTLITEEYTPKKGTQISTESFGFQTEWKVVFEVNLDGRIPSSHENIFRVTKGGLGYSNKDQCGDRYPAVWHLAENSLSQGSKNILFANTVCCSSEKNSVR